MFVGCARRSRHFGILMELHRREWREVLLDRRLCRAGFGGVQMDYPKGPHTTHVVALVPKLYHLWFLSQGP